MAKTIIATKNAPGAIGPYSQGIRANSFVFASGQIGLDPATGEFVKGGLTGFSFALNLIATLLMLISTIAAIFSGYDYLKHGKELFK